MADQIYDKKGLKEERRSIKQELESIKIKKKSLKQEIKVTIIEIEESVPTDISDTCNRSRATYKRLTFDQILGSFDNILRHIQEDINCNTILAKNTGSPDEHEINILQIVDDIIDNIQQTLTEDFKPGTFIKIGSNYPGAISIQDTADIDYLYECSLNENIQLVPVSDEHKHVVKFVSSVHIPSANDIYENFAECITSSIDKYNIFPPCLVHGGFASVKFSGIRRNEPAVTLLFVYQTVDSPTEQTIYKEITVDLSIGYLLPEYMSEDIIDHIKIKVKGINLEWSNTEEKLHLVSIYPEDNEWSITSAHVERIIFEHLSQKCNIFDTLQHCKYICAKAITEYSDFDIQQEPISEWLHNALSKYREIKQITPEDGDLERLRIILADILSRAHIFLHRKEGVAFQETTTRKLVKINSAALKFHTIKVVLNLLEEKNINTVNVNPQNVLNTLPNAEPYITHPFLDYKVKLVSLAFYAVNSAEFIKMARK